MSVIDRAHRMVLFLMAVAVPAVFLLDFVVEWLAGELSMAPGTWVYFALSGVAVLQILTKRWSADWIILLAGSGTAAMALLRYFGTETLMDLNTGSVIVPILGLVAIAIGRRGQIPIGWGLGVATLPLVALALREANADPDVVTTSTAAVAITFVFSGAILQLLRRGYEEQVLARDRFVASVSHELRSPLTGLLGFVEILSDDGRDSDVVALIRSQASEAVDIVEDLLVAARFESRQVAISIAPTDAVAEVQSVIEAQRLSQWAEGRAMESTLAPLRVMSDPLRLRQVVRNLLSNALRHGGDRIVVRTFSSEGLGHVEVSDDGVGFDEAEAEMIFSPYGRAAQTDRATGSIGLGLTVSRQLAQAMGGDLVAMRTDEFTTFRLSLPLATPSEN